MRGLLCNPIKTIPPFLARIVKLASCMLSPLKWCFVAHCPLVQPPGFDWASDEVLSMVFATSDPHDHM